jgi:hypothetical protein
VIWGEIKAALTGDKAVLSSDSGYFQEKMAVLWGESGGTLKRTRRYFETMKAVL